MIGWTIAHYRILEKLGEGGMGEVYLAEDSRLKRKIAVKFLPSHLTKDKQSRERFEREAQAAAVLNHPNIVTVHEIGEYEGQIYISMEYVEGETLRDKIDQYRSSSTEFSVDEIITISMQICEGLGKAHQAEIIHRDIKPGNIIIDKDNRVKILDFGLAKLRGANQLTKERSTLGTIHYMSPEQTQGDEVDHKTDIWSLGVVLYEMHTGKLPFKGEYEQAVVFSILNAEPEPISGMPMELGRIINKALAKSPKERYQNVEEIMADLKSLGKEIEPEQLQEQSKKESVPSIAVMPFADMSPQKDQEYFCDGMAEEIINALTHLNDLRVIARTSAFAFKGKHEDVREIGRKLDVETLLEGSVRKAGNRLRITAQLVEVVDGSHLWSERYDRELEDIFDIQDEIARTVANKLKVTLERERQEPLVRPPTENIVAYNLYLKGRFLVGQMGEGTQKALEHFQRALALDPEYALAHAGVADSYNFLGDWNIVPRKEAMMKAKEAAMRALELDGTLSEAHIALGWMNMSYDYDWQSAEKHFLRAIELDPNNADAHSRYALFLYWVRGRFDEAVSEGRLSVELDPLSEARNTWFGRVLYGVGRVEEGIAQLRRAVELDPTSLHAHFILSDAYRIAAMYPEAIAELQTAIELVGRHPWPLWVLGMTYANSGNKSEANAIYNELVERSQHEYVQPVIFALIDTALGRKDEAFEALDRAYEEHDGLIVNMKSWQAFDPLRDDARFDALMKKMGMEK
jgi:serine/threonine protein kinase/Tfp pilus assembly protein PilF